MADCRYGCVPEFGNISLNEVRLTGAPITVAMSKILSSELFLVTESVFCNHSDYNIIYLYWKSLKDFLKDIFQNSFHIENRYFIFIVAFIPPLTITYPYADIF